MKNRALKHGLLAAALAVSIGAAPTSAHAADYNLWRTHFGSTTAAISAWLSLIPPMLDGSTR